MTKVRGLIRNVATRVEKSHVASHCKNFKSLNEIFQMRMLESTEHSTK